MYITHSLKEGNIGMKRTFPLLLALVLLIAVFPMSSAMAGREEDCQHFLNQFKTYKEYRTLDAYSHQMEKWEAYYCPYCDVIFRSIAWLVASEEQWHAFSNNKCTLCGYTQKACSHERQDITNSRFTYEPIPGDSVRHLTTCYNTWFCLDCGKITLYDEGWYSQEECHDYNTNGKCVLCGYKNSTTPSGSCNHVNHNSTPVGNIEYNQIWGDNTNHEVERHYKITCSDCGKMIDDDYIGKTTEKHSFDWYGDCTKCGYTKSGASSPSATAFSASSLAPHAVNPNISAKTNNNATFFFIRSSYLLY